MIEVALSYPEGGYVPDGVWYFMTDLAIFSAAIAAVSGIVWLWNRGPEKLIKYGPEWMTKLGIRWGKKRDLKKNGVPDEQTD